MNIESADVLLELYLKDQVKLESSPTANEIYIFDTGEEHYLTMENVDAAITYSPSPSHAADLVDIEAKSNLICVGGESDFIEFLEMSEDEQFEKEPVRHSDPESPNIQNIPLFKLDQVDESVEPEETDNDNQQTLCTLMKHKNEDVPMLFIEENARPDGTTEAKIHINRRAVIPKKKKTAKSDLICQICAKTLTVNLK
jgi:hypothetical protein